VGKVPVFISPRNRVAQLHPQAPGSLFVGSYDSQGYGGGIRPRLHTGSVEVDLSYTTYHIREERAYRVVIRNLYHTVTTDEIKEELEKQGHIARNIPLNVRHRHCTLHKMSVLRAYKNTLGKTVYLC
jgi:hypothetical protein